MWVQTDRQAVFSSPFTPSSKLLVSLLALLVVGYERTNSDIFKEWDRFAPGDRFISLCLSSNLHTKNERKDHTVFSLDKPSLDGKGFSLSFLSGGGDLILFVCALLQATILFVWFDSFSHCSITVLLCWSGLSTGLILVMGSQKNFPLPPVYKEVFPVLGHRGGELKGGNFVCLKVQPLLKVVFPEQPYSFSVFRW